MSSAAQSAYPWPSGSATGIGSMPGTDAREVVRAVTGTLEHFPFLPELPARGPGADMIGRTGGMLPGLHIELQPSGWRFADRPGRDERRARAWLGEDLDALEEFAQTHTGPLKVQVVGPWTLAAGIELRGGQPALSDPGACRDIAASLSEAIREHLTDLHRRLPTVRPVLQLDEPSLPSVLAGAIPTASGFSRIAAPDRALVESALRDLIDTASRPAPSAVTSATTPTPAVGERPAGRDGRAQQTATQQPDRDPTPVLIHCCAPDAPLPLLRRTQATAFALDFTLLTERDDDHLGESFEQGLGLLAGILPSTDPPTGPSAASPGLSDPGGSVTPIRTLWRRLGLNPRTLPESVVITPTCGLAAASPRYANAVLELAAQAAKSLSDDPEG